MKQHLRCLMTLAVISLLSGFVSSCATLSGESQAQLAYDACAGSHNNEQLDQSWAFVSGVGEFNRTCFWAYGAESEEVAVNRAVENCKKEYSDCFVFSTSNGLSDWSRQISDQGGVAGGGGGWSFADFVNLGAAGADLYNAYSNSGGGTVAPAPSTPTDTFDNGNSAPASCGRHYVGLIPQSVCRMGGNLPDSSISSDEDPDPIANCWTPPC